MRLNSDQWNAINMALAGRNCLIIGRSGTGKTEVIKSLKCLMEHKGLNVVLTAPTGMAADLIDGVTIHSFLHVHGKEDFTQIDSDYYREKLKSVDVLIVDEVSMLGAKMTDVIYTCIIAAQRNVQVIFVGDFGQLKAVEDKFAFLAKCWDGFSFSTYELTEIVRQDDPEFVENIRLLSEANPLCIPYLLSKNDTKENDGVYICPTNECVKYHNRIRISQLPGNGVIFKAQNCDGVDFSNSPVEKSLIVKENMEVLALKNMRSEGYLNGSRGRVLDIYRDYVLVDFGKGEPAKVHAVDMPVWNSITKMETYVNQLPIVAAYAMTVNRCQGQTFEKANIYAGSFAYHGQLYVATTRPKSINGIHFMSKPNASNLVMAKEVQKYHEKIRKAA